MSYNFTSEDVKLVEKLIDLKNRGFYADGKEVTDLHNKILGTRLTPTNCGSCVRQRITALETALNAFKRAIELEKKQEPTPIKGEENNAVTASKNDDIKERMAKVRAARKQKK